MEPLNTIGGNGVAGPVARGVHAGQHAAQAVEDELIHKAAAVVAHVEDHAFFADLREVLLDEFIQPLRPHVGEIDIADAPVAGCSTFLRLLSIQVSSRRPYSSAMGFTCTVWAPSSEGLELTVRVTFRWRCSPAARRDSAESAAGARSPPADSRLALRLPRVRSGASADCGSQFSPG